MSRSIANSALSRAAACSDLARAAIGAEAPTYARARPFDEQRENAQKTTVLENVIPEIVGFNFDRDPILELSIVAELYAPRSEAWRLLWRR